MSIPKALTVAGSDSGGGAGIQADIKTFQELGVFGMSAITAITVQNTLGVQGVYPLPAAAAAEQMNAVGTDLGVDAVKTGMLFSADIIEAVAGRIAAFGWRNVVVDPVMVAKGGARLLQQDAVDALKNKLLPLAAVVTPNIPEAEVLAGMAIRSMEERCEAAYRIAAYGPAMVVIKGGHDESSDKAVDLTFDGESFSTLEGSRIDTRHTHGTGCTFSAAIAAELAKGNPVNEAVRTAREFIQAAIENSLGIGGGSGPTNHWAYRSQKEGAVR
ncbi:bifunctional hydroxymethylpyrimidine kinase/phosphomethylpyrimidine kinase [Paenibacillus cellulositrophicus]|uniref:bifunctional hydroxymethylpyrimidine kinase/phosphomethylpyrimidine kinase n=1 Tax=Paenibacillus cellulositrophicus TaxID=562959 RepID=UPI003F7CF7FA